MSRAKHIVAAIIFIISSATLSAENLHPKSSGEIVEHTYYTLAYDEECEQAKWVSYTLTPEMVVGTTARKDAFKSDPKVSTLSAHPNDYKSSGYDRGHLCPAASMSHNATAMAESFYMSNMSPQAPSFNRGGWKRLEELVRRWVQEEELLQVVSGGVLNDIKEYIGENRVAVPKLYYKAIYSPNREKMIAFLMPNGKISENLQEYVVSVDSIEKVTNIDLYHALEDALQRRCESKSDTSLWSF